MLYCFFGGILPYCSKLVILTFLDSGLVLVGVWLLGFVSSLGKNRMSSEEETTTVGWNGLMRNLGGRI